MKDLNRKIVDNYLTTLLEPIKYGENCVFCWFNGAGMTTVLADLFANKKLLKASLGNLYTSLVFYEFYGNTVLNKDSKNLLADSGFADFDALRTNCTAKLNKGKELVLIVSKIDDYPEKEKLLILKIFQKLNAINPRRVHILFNTHNKPWFVTTINKNPELLALATRIEIMPLIKGKLLAEYIKTRAKQYEYQISEVELIRTAKVYGGMLRLTKEYLRSHGETGNLELKFKLIWNTFPDSYRKLLESNLNKTVIKSAEADFLDLNKFGVLDLEAFRLHSKALSINSGKILKTILTKNEQDLYEFLINNQGRLIDKDTVINLLRPENPIEVSLWSIDKAVSRFRVKLAKSSIDPTIFKTVKGKGYQWTDN